MRMSWLDAFMIMMPPSQITLINLWSRASSDMTSQRAARAGLLLQPSPHLTPTKEKRLNENVRMMILHLTAIRDTAEYAGQVLPLLLPLSLLVATQ
jgi:hypothetical protein